MSKKYSFLIGVENYQDNSINPVDYAENDVLELSNTINELGFDESNQIILNSNGATKATIESKLRRQVRRLTDDDILIFFYAGHGFSRNDINYITTFDSQLGDLENTSIQLQDIFSQFKNSDCNKIIMFLDACESGMQIDETAREIFYPIQEQVLEELLVNAEYQVCFASCKSDEKSYPSTKLKHGIWTYHLIEALSGNATDAVIGNSKVTSESLQNYLVTSVRKTLRETYNRPYVQTPWVFGGKTNEFLIADVEDILERRRIENVPINRELQRSSLRKIELENVSRLSGFKKSHRVPEEVNHYTENFVQDISKDDLDQRLDIIFQSMRKNFNYKARDLNVAASAGSASIISPDFDYSISVRLMGEDPSYVEWEEEVSNIHNPEILRTEEFDTIFRNKFDTIRLELGEPIDVAQIINDVEELDIGKIRVDYPYDMSMCTITHDDKNWKFIVNDVEFCLINEHTSNVIQLIDAFEDFRYNLLERTNIQGFLTEPE